MNRICKSFDDIGNINMNWAGVAPFNWQMLMEDPCYDMRDDIVETFCDLDSTKLSLDILESEMSPAERDLYNTAGIVEEHITHVLTKKFGSLDVCYPHIAKYLFSGENIDKSSHKQSFWKIFGAKAVEILCKNLEDCSVCAECGARVPAWSNQHLCPKNTQGFYACIDCGKISQRTNSRQCRCKVCQEEYHAKQRKIQRDLKKKRMKERDYLFTTSSQSPYSET